MTTYADTLNTFASLFNGGNIDEFRESELVPNKKFVGLQWLFKHVHGNIWRSRSHYASYIADKYVNLIEGELIMVIDFRHILRQDGSLMKV